MSLAPRLGGAGLDSGLKKRSNAMERLQKAGGLSGIGPFSSLLLLTSILFGAAALGAAEVPSFFGIKPGTTTRAEVELMLGEPLSPAGDETKMFDYPPPAGAADAGKVAIGFFPDTKEVSRLDVYLKTPLAAEGLRQEFGRAAFVQEKADGIREEFYYPRYQGIVLAGDQQGDRVLAIVFLSPRYLSGLFVARSVSCLAKKDQEQARLEAEKAVLADPDYAAGYTAQARCFYALKDYDQALAVLARGLAARYSPAAKAEAHTLAGLIQRTHKNSPEAAARELAQAIALSAEYAPAHFQLGMVLLAQDNKVQAAAEFSRALEIDPKYTSARVRLADYLYDSKEFGKALEHYEILSAWSAGEAAASADNDLKAQLNFRHGYCLLKAINELMPDYDAPIAAFKRAISLNPREEIYYSNMGYAFELKGDWASAEQAYTKCISLKPESVFGHRHLGNALLEQGRLEEALERVQKAQTLAPRDPNLMMEIARCYAAMKKKGPARDWIRRAVLAGYSDNGDRWAFDPYFQTVFKDKELAKLLQAKS